MRRMKAPHVPEQPVAVLSEDELRKLLATCSGTTFEDRRDNAIIRLSPIQECGAVSCSGLACRRGHGGRPDASRRLAEPLNAVPIRSLDSRRSRTGGTPTPVPWRRL